MNFGTLLGRAKLTLISPGDVTLTWYRPTYVPAFKARFSRFGSYIHILFSWNYSPPPPNISTYLSYVLVPHRVNTILYTVSLHLTVKTSMKMKTFLFFWCLILASEACHCLPPEEQASEAKDSIRGYYHVWWTIIPVPSDTVRDMLPGEFTKFNRLVDHLELCGCFKATVFGLWY